MKPTDEQIREFWKWYGIVLNKEMTKRMDMPLSWWNLPNGDTYYGKMLPIDLNNLFKYAVPKFPDWGLTQNLGSGYVYAWVFDGEKRGVSVDETHPALALFWALWAVKEAT